MLSNIQVTDIEIDRELNVSILKGGGYAAPVTAYRNGVTNICSASREGIKCLEQEPY